MSNDYTGISARCEVEAARPGDEAGCELLSDGEFAVVLSDHGNETIVVIEGTPAELLALVRRAHQVLKEQVSITTAASS
ncbi:hypothetical protein [Amycolatopsis sp. cmx-8-4]|uniref:hypothetical protein n=1 Tax=Amycolatopsis sp. cmx-8-4 TaxID=2790947 RepID=UPI00397AB3A1